MDRNIKNIDIDFLIKERFKTFGIEADDMEMMLKNIKTYNFRQGQNLYQNKSSCYGFVILRSGILRAYLISPSKSESAREITIFELHSGEECVICANCTSDNLSLEVNIQAKQDCEIIVIPQDIFSSMKDKYPLLANHILSLISNRFSKSIEVMSSALFMPLSSRILNLLESKMDKNKEISITHENIANELGSVREAVSRILKEMEHQNIIKTSRGKIAIM